MRFLSVTKPGIIFGNLIAVLGGYFLALSPSSLSPDSSLSSLAAYPFDVFHLLWTLLGISFVIASGCVFNNIIDRDIDRIMERTKNRVLAKDELSIPVALLYAVILGLLGFAVLFFKTNFLTVEVTLVGYIGYAVIYSLFIKRRWIMSTPIGAIAGAVPPLAGYCAVTNQLDAGGWLIFLILFLWQMPHFYAIAIYRLDDFKSVPLPVLPLRKGVRYTQGAILFYILLFIFTTLLPTLLNYEGYFYFAVALCTGLIWLALGIKGFNTQDAKHWARKMFLFSIINLTVLCVTLTVLSLVSRVSLF